MYDVEIFEMLKRNEPNSYWPVDKLIMIANAVSEENLTGKADIISVTFERAMESLAEEAPDD